MECFTSRSKLLGYLVLTCIMVGGAYFCTTLPDSVANIFGWIGIAFFGLGFIISPIRFLRWGAVIVINEFGIEDRRWGTGVIPWEDIESMSIYSVENCACLQLWVKDPAKYVTRMSWWNRKISDFNKSSGFSPIQLDFVAVSPGIDEAIRYIKFRWRDRVKFKEEREQEKSNQQGHFSALDP
jgi:hypothetical protein